MSQLRVEVSRRGFLGTVFSASALVLGANLLPTEAEAATTVDAAAWHPSVYLGLEPNGDVIIVAHRSEMGTGIRTALPTVVADELEADWKRVIIQQAIGDKKYGDQNTDGSNSVRSFFEPMRRAGATARTMLESAAASQWSVPVSEVKAQNHEVVHAKTGRKLAFGVLVATAVKQPVPAPETLKFKTEAEYRYIGKDLPITDLADLVTGKGTFGQDARVPGMVYASIERCPVFEGKLKSVDNKETLAVKGVYQTETIDPYKPPFGFKPVGGVAVIANNTWAALQGRKKLKLDWDLGPHASWESASFRKELEASARKDGARVSRNEGDAEAALKAGAKTHEAEYFTGGLSHAPMEPPAAIADYKDGKVTIWTCTQNPQAVQDTVAEAVGLKPQDVICNVTLLGGGFGRKSKPDYAAEAAMLSRKLNKPVKVVWSREDDIHFDYFHSPAAMFLKAALDAKGRPTAWLGRTAFPPIGNMNNATEKYGGGQVGMGFSDIPYEIANIRIENGPAETHHRIGWLRSVGHIHHAFAVHSFIDELAALANRDRVEYQLDLLGSNRKIDLRPAAQRSRPDPYMPDIVRFKRVLETLAQNGAWASKKSGNGKGYGIVVHRSFLSYIGCMVEVELDGKGGFRVPRVDYVVDAGRVIHPDRVKAQFQGAAVFGIGLTKYSEITAAGGVIQQANFNNYQVARIGDTPLQTNVTIIGTDAPPAGVGEPGVPPIAPAICNAIFAATGKRVRELPLKNVKLA